MSDFRPLWGVNPCSKIMSEIVMCSGGHLTTVKDFNCQGQQLTTSFELPSSHARVTSIKFTKQESVSQSVRESLTSITNDRTRVR